MRRSLVMVLLVMGCADDPLPTDANGLQAGDEGEAIALKTDGAGTTYLLRAYRPEVATPTESDPIAPPAVALSALAVKHPRPNPFNPRVVLRYAAPAEADVRLPAPAGGGWQSVTWDGRDASGGGVPSGQYFFEITAGGETRTERMTLVR